MFTDEAEPIHSKLTGETIDLTNHMYRIGMNNTSSTTREEMCVVNPNLEESSENCLLDASLLLGDEISNSKTRSLQNNTGVVVDKSHNSETVFAEEVSADAQVSFRSSSQLVEKGVDENILDVLEERNTFKASGSDAAVLGNQSNAPDSNIVNNFTFHDNVGFNVSGNLAVVGDKQNRQAHVTPDWDSSSSSLDSNTAIINKHSIESAAVENEQEGNIDEKRISFDRENPEINSQKSEALDCKGNLQSRQHYTEINNPSHGNQHSEYNAKYIHNEFDKEHTHTIESKYQDVKEPGKIDDRVLAEDNSTHNVAKGIIKSAHDSGSENDTFSTNHNINSKVTHAITVPIDLTYFDNEENNKVDVKDDLRNKDTNTTKPDAQTDEQVFNKSDSKTDQDKGSIKSLDRQNYELIDNLIESQKSSLTGLYDNNGDPDLRESTPVKRTNTHSDKASVQREKLEASDSSDSELSEESATESEGSEADDFEVRKYSDQTANVVGSESDDNVVVAGHYFTQNEDNPPAEVSNYINELTEKAFINIYEESGANLVDVKEAEDRHSDISNKDILKDVETTVIGNYEGDSINGIDQGLLIENQAGISGDVTAGLNFEAEEHTFSRPASDTNPSSYFEISNNDNILSEGSNTKVSHDPERVLDNDKQLFKDSDAASIDSLLTKAGVIKFRINDIDAVSLEQQDLRSKSEFSEDFGEGQQSQEDIDDTIKNKLKKVKCNKFSAENTSLKSNISYTEDFTQEDTSRASSRRSSVQTLDNRSITPLSYISLDDRAITSRPVIPGYDSDQDTSNDEALESNFARMSRAPPTTIMNESAEILRRSRPKSSHPKRRREKQVSESVVYRHKDMDDSWDKRTEESRAYEDEDHSETTTVHHGEQEFNYSIDEFSDGSYSDDLESTSLQSPSGVSKNDGISVVSEGNHFNSQNDSHVSRGPSALSYDNASEASRPHRFRENSMETFSEGDQVENSKRLESKTHDFDEQGLKTQNVKDLNTKSTARNSEDGRVIQITGATENLTQMQENLQDMFRQAKSVLSEFQSQLKTRPMQDLTNEVPVFTRTLTSLSDAYKACEVVTGGINEQLHDMRALTNEICELLATNFKSEDLELWTDQPGNEDETSEEAEARAKVKVAKVLEFKAVSSRATADALMAHERAVQAQLEASQAEAAAARAKDEAIFAVRKAESARKAAIEKKHLEEEEEKQREVERQRQQEEVSRLQKEAEERALQRTLLNMGEKRITEETVPANDPSTWPRMIYSIDRCDFDTGVGVVIKAQEGHLQHDDVTVTVVDQLTGCLPLGEWEELISNIIKVTIPDRHNHKNAFSKIEPFVVALPHCAPRIHPGREPVIRMLTQDGKSVTLATTELQFDDIKDLRFAECRTKTFGTFAVFLRLKKETLTFHRKGGKLMSSADSRVTLACQSGTFANDVTFTLEVQQIDHGVLTSLKNNLPEECDQLLSTSPIITMRLPVKFSTPLTITLPVPPNPSHRPRRPQTAGNMLTTDKMDTKEIRLSSARSMYTSKEEETALDELHLLLKESGGLWSTLNDVTLIQLKKKDVVAFDINRSFDKLAIIRTKPEVTPSQAEKIFCHLMTALTFKNMTVLTRQKSSDPNSVVLTCTQSMHLDRALRALSDEGYDHGPRPTPDITVTEGQRLSLRLRGNLTLEDCDARTMFAFNTYIPFKVMFRVHEQDKFAQRGFDSYRGFCQVFAKAKVKRFLELTDEKDQRSTPSGLRGKEEFVDGDILLCEQLITLPKPEPETPRPLMVAPVFLSAEGIVNLDLFKFLSVHLEDSDWKKLAQLLNVRHNRIQAILRQNVSNDVTQSIYDMLVTWSKRLPRSMDRTDILCKALACIRRLDLAGEILNREEEFRQIRALQLKDSYLRKAFVTIVRNPQAVTQWKELARALSISEQDVTRAEATLDSDQARCMSVLTNWKERAREEATVSLLANKLRQCRFRHLSKEVDRIYQTKLIQELR